MTKNPIKTSKAVLIFALSSLYFFLLLYTLLPFLKSRFIINPASYWFITGYFLFIPLFAAAIIMVKKEGNRGLQKIMRSLCIKTFSRKDWIYAVSGLFLAFLSTGLIFFISFLLNSYWGLGELKTTPWFMELKPFRGVEKLLLLLWLPMFFFNITGEELLWRGYIQARLSHKNSWILCSLLWILFHLPFGSGIIIMALPVLVLIPYIFSKTQNTLISVFIHGIYNGPIFVLIALGIMK